MKMSEYTVNKISEDELAKFNKDFLVQRYEEGLRRKEIIVNEMSFRRLHHSFEVMVLGNLTGGGYTPYKLNGATSQMSYNDFYKDWRETVMSALSASTIPSHLRLSFMTTPKDLIGSKYLHSDRDEIARMVVDTFNRVLEKLLEIISHIPDVHMWAAKSEEIVSEYGTFAITETGAILKNGKSLKVPNQQRKILAALIKENGRPISREGLIEILWNEDDGTLKYLENPMHTPEKMNKTIRTVISKLNSSLRDTSDHKQYVLNSSIKGAVYLSS
jgi:DNA-binding winged helix-turn-helix (wHTH) protein